MSYRVIERTLCGGRDIYSNKSAEEVARWIEQNGYLSNTQKREADIYLILPDGSEIETSDLKSWSAKVLKRRMIDKLKRLILKT